MQGAARRLSRDETWGSGQVLGAGVAGLAGACVRRARERPRSPIRRPAPGGQICGCTW